MVNCYFIFGFKKQTEEFLFCYYMSVYSAYIINNPNIYFYYHFEPYGEWWEKLKQIPNIKFIKVNIPTHIGKKTIKKVAHKADWLRMNLLYKYGGIYLDIDTICVKPWENLLLNHDVVLGEEDNNNVPTICNAIMYSKPKSAFFNKWLNLYEKYFVSDGWGEASLQLPHILSEKFPDLLNLQKPDTFFIPTWTKIEDIFVNKKNIPNKLVSLHLWESFSLKFMSKIKDISWAYKNKDTLYGKLLLNIIEKSKCSNIINSPMSKHTIPLNIFITYKTKNMQPDMINNIESLKKKNPEFKLYFYDDKMCEDFLKEFFNEDVLYCFKKLKPGAYKADLWRCCILYIYGGIYMDIKLNTVNNFKLIDLTDKEYFVIDTPACCGKMGIWNGLLVCNKNNNILKKTIDCILENVNNNKYCSDTLSVSGPNLIVDFFTKKQFNNLELKLKENREQIYICNGNNKLLESYYKYRKDLQNDNYTTYSEYWVNRDIYNYPKIIFSNIIINKKNDNKYQDIIFEKFYPLIYIKNLKRNIKHATNLYYFDNLYSSHYSEYKNDIYIIHTIKKKFYDKHRFLYFISKFDKNIDLIYHTELFLLDLESDIKNIIITKDSIEIAYIDKYNYKIMVLKLNDINKLKRYLHS